MTRQPLGAPSSRFRRQRLLVVGCGDVGARLVRQLRGRAIVRALSSGGFERCQELRAQGITVLRGNLDDPRSVRRLSALAHRVVHLAPPAPSGTRDTRTRDLVRALGLRTAPAAFVYGSTSGVYGDCSGSLVSETRPSSPSTERAQRRGDAEAAVRAYGKTFGVVASVLRVPGIYASDRKDGTPRQRLLRGTPVLAAPDDVFTNHIHAEDLACACLLAMWRAAPQRCYNISDDTQLRMGDYFDLAADLYALPRPPRLSRARAAELLPPVVLSFMSESRRLINTRMKAELGLRLRYPTVREGLAARL